MIGNLLVFIIFQLLICASVAAQRVEGTLPFESEPQDQWVLVYRGETLELVRADVRKTPESLTVTAYIENLPEDSLVSEVMLGADEKIYATPLHYPFRIELTKGSNSIAQIQLEESKRKLVLHAREIKNLKDQIAAKNKLLRQAAGLGEVDAIYDKLADVEEQTAMARKAKEDAERALERSREG